MARDRAAKERSHSMTTIDDRDHRASRDARLRFGAAREPKLMGRRTGHLRRVVPILCACLVAFRPAAGFAQARATPEVRDWLSGVVAKVDASVGDRGGGIGRGARTSVGVRVAVAADGVVRQVVVERGSGSRRIDGRAVVAVEAAGPFPAPPRELLTEDGTTTLSFPVEVPRRP